MRFLIIILLLTSCKSIPQGSFESTASSETPDYSDLDNWAAAAQKEDNADRTPGSLFDDLQSDADADVFFLHPTSYTRDRGNTEWNAQIDDQELNAKTDDGSILFQASVFNGAAKIYAPRYRQAHIYVFYSNDKNYNKGYAEKALELAYSDIKKAFEYYLENWNNGRPIIIASHSQGTTHAVRLMQEYFDGKPLANQLVAAYLIGMPVQESSFSELKPCETSNETGCLISWRAYQRGFLPEWKDPADDIIVTNPLSWKTDTTYVNASQNNGTVLYNFDKGIVEGISDAQVHKGHLWVTKPKFPGSAFMRFKNYHIADYNLFYVDIRNNAEERVRAFLERENQ